MHWLDTAELTDALSASIRKYLPKMLRQLSLDNNYIMSVTVLN